MQEHSGGPQAHVSSAAPAEQSAPSGGTDAFAELVGQLAELRESAALLLQVSTDRVRLRLRRIAILVAMWAVAVFALLCFVASAVRLVVVGIAGGAVELFGGRAWLGDCVTGAALLLAALLVIRAALARGAAIRHRQLVQRYERGTTRDSA